mmetsp:Transcript_4920/g.7343  ORF Transcript_4920/g.7343 Transcript_4920/m.7343 type:complete len:277 (-) Transcript_4920:1354-2184(-)
MTSGGSSLPKSTNFNSGTLVVVLARAMSMSPLRQFSRSCFMSSLPKNLVYVSGSVDLNFATPLIPHAISKLASSTISAAILDAMKVLSSFPSRHAANAVLYVWKFGEQFRERIRCSHIEAMAAFFVFAQAPSTVVYETTLGSMPSLSIPIRIPSQPIIFPVFANLLRAMLKVIMLPSVSRVSLIRSRTFTVRSSSPQTSHVLTTVLNTFTGGLSALPSFASVIQSIKIAVAFLLFSFLQQVATTLLHTLVAGVNPRFGINSNSFTASFQPLSLHAC